MSDVNVVTNGHARPVIDGWLASSEVRAEFDYVDWDAVDRGEVSWTGLRYRGSLYDLGEFERSTGTLASDWDGWQPQSAFDAIAFRWAEDWSGEPDYDHVVVAHLHW